MREETKSERIDEIQWVTENGRQTHSSDVRKKRNDLEKQRTETPNARRTKNDRQSKQSRRELTKYSGRAIDNKTAKT